jgi:hypothetical protein
VQVYHKARVFLSETNFFVSTEHSRINYKSNVDNPPKSYFCPNKDYRDSYTQNTYFGFFFQNVAFVVFVDMVLLLWLF